MRNITLLITLILLAHVGLSQPRNGLKGPEAKNYKPWQDDKTSTKVMVTRTDQNLMGPEAKNYKPWKYEAGEDSMTKVIDTSIRKERLMGPAAKNHKPWRD